MADIISQLKEQFLQIGQKIGLVKKTGSKPVAGAVKPVRSKKFDFNLFIKATQDFWTEFFETKVPAFFKNPGPYFKNYPAWFKSLTKDEMVAHVVVYTGLLFVIAGIVLIIAL